MRSYLSSSARHQATCGRRLAPPHTHTPPRRLRRRSLQTARSSKRRWRPFFTRTPCHTRTAFRRPPPYRPDRTGHVDRRSIVVVVGGIPARPRSGRPEERARGVGPAGAAGRICTCVSPWRPGSLTEDCNLYAGPHARVRPPRDGRPLPCPGRGGPHTRGCHRFKVPSAALPRAGPTGFHRLRHDRGRRRRAGGRDLDAAGRSATAGGA